MTINMTILQRISFFMVMTLLVGCIVTPEVMTVSTALKSAQEDQQTLVKEYQSTGEAIDLYEAIARALKHNRERRMKLMEAVLSESQLKVANYDMLPELSVSAGYRNRSQYGASATGIFGDDGSISQSNPQVYSVSAQKNNNTLDLGLTWNILDFGLSYLRAGQQADRYLIAQERERKAIHNLIQDVRSSYWRAASAQRLLRQIKPLRIRIESALADSRKIEAMRLLMPLDELLYQREFLDIRRSLEAVQKDLHDAKTTLATLMGMKPNRVFNLKAIDQSSYEVLDVKLDAETLERTALAKRPELMESRYQKRITRDEGRAALVSLLPGVDLNFGLHHDSNEYLKYPEWHDYGGMIMLNLINIFKLPAISQQIDNQNEVEDERRLALSAAVLGQVHLSLIAYQQAKREFSTASEYLSIVHRLAGQMRQHRDVGNSGELKLIREEFNEVLADLRRDVSYANLQNSYGRIFMTAGLDPLPEMVTNDSIEGIAAAIKDQFEIWKAGEIGLVASPINKQIKPWKGPGQHQFSFSKDTFSLGGAVSYQAFLRDGTALPQWLMFNSETRTFSGNPPAIHSELEITVTAENSYGAKAHDRFSLWMENTNDEPTVSGQTTYSIACGEGVLSDQLVFHDADDDTLNYKLIEQNKPAGFVLDETGHWQFDADHENYQELKLGQEKKHIINISVSDTYGGSLESALEITVVGSNFKKAIEPTGLTSKGNSFARYNNPPKLISTVLGNGLPTYFISEEGIALFGSTKTSTIEPEQTLTELILTVENSIDDAHEKLTIAGVEFELMTGVSGTINSSIDYLVTKTGSTATVELTGEWDSETVNRLVDSIKYRNSSKIATTDQKRIITLTSLKDSGGVKHGGIDTRDLSIGTSITLSRINKAPMFNTVATHSGILTAGGKVSTSALFNSTTSSTVELNQTFVELQLTVANLADGKYEKLIIEGVEFSLEEANTDSINNNTHYRVKKKGDVATVILTGDWSSANVNSLVDSIKYLNRSESVETGKMRVIILTSLKDSGGTHHGGIDTKALNFQTNIMLFDRSRLSSNKSPTFRYP